MKTNPVLKTIKDGDLVLFHSPAVVSMAGLSPEVYQIARLTNVKYLPPDQRYSFDWLDYDAELLYSTIQLPEDNMKTSLNCLAISQVIPNDLLENTVHSFRLFDPRKYPLSKAEQERILQKYI
jgi:hypothetical protein